MNTQAMNAMPQRLSIYDPKRDRMVSLNPYKAKAKEIYRHYIEDLGLDPSLILPPDLVYYEKSGYFRKNPTKQLTIESRTAYKTYLSSYTVHNVNQDSSSSMSSRPHSTNSLHSMVASSSTRQLAA